MKKYGINRYALHIILLLLAPLAAALAAEKLLVQLKDFTQTEVKCGGFNLPATTSVHIFGLGGGEKKSTSSNKRMYAYGWIIDADTRQIVWEMKYDNTQPESKFRKFDGEITLPKGSYEVYYAAYGFFGGSVFSSFLINIDRRDQHLPSGTTKKKGFLNWLEEVFGGDYMKEWQQIARKLEISVYADQKYDNITMFNPPKEFQNVLFAATKLGENEHIRQRFALAQPIPVHIYALGEQNFSGGQADYGYIVDLKTRKRIWDSERSYTENAGGDAKNIKFDGVVEFPAGDFIIYFNTDDSHSYLDWNAAPPADPLNYGITLMATSKKDASSFKLLPMGVGKEQVIVQLTKVGDDETKTANFTLKEDATIRIYAIGERSYSRRQMADYGWITNSRTREKVWTMDPEKTEHAGGSEKNRMVDELLTLPKGSYTVTYRTDDSHSYDDWNDDPPNDPEHYGITIYGEGENFSKAMVDEGASPSKEGIIAQIIHVGNNAKLVKKFHLDKLTHIRIYALGEGQNREMYDYGWIENANTGSVVWEMTYSMTFHAGGGRKNRSVSTTIVLDKGDYTLHYVSDDSHSYDDWNTDPPDDPDMWGITLYEEK